MSWSSRPWILDLSRASFISLFRLLPRAQKTWYIQYVWKIQTRKNGISIFFPFVRKYLNEIWPRDDLWRVSGEKIFMKFEHKVWRLIKCSPYISQNNKLLRADPWLEKSLDDFVIFTASWFISCGAWVEILKLQGPQVVNVKVWLHYQSWRQYFIVKVGENLVISGI